MTIFYGLQPALLAGAMTLWYINPGWDAGYIATLLGLQILLGCMEYWRPARPHWRQRWPERLRNIGIWFVGSTLAVTIIGWYHTHLTEPLAVLRERLQLDIWPHEWPVLVQVLMVFLLAELIWYWIHRAEHRWGTMWRVTGHGAHHSFKRLGAINFGANHPFEIAFLVLPAATIELLFGVGAAAAGAAMLALVQVSVAHANLRMNSQVIGWLFTTNDYHLLHHSIVLEESNTNYGCAAIVWDRLFGTFAHTKVAEAGTGAIEPGTWRKFLMPFKEPEGVDIAPT
ncbi:MAG: sterol desaturase family protein [Pseudomonadota bacterium]